jgi:glycosyltransferase involved in cell wall biosynthesis
MKPFSVCIVSHNGYGAIAGSEGGYIGGIEWQTSVLARWLAARGHQVSFITWHEGGPDEETLQGVRVIKVCRRTDGMKGLRFVHPRWTGLTRALRRADASVCYQNGGEVVTGQVGLWSRARRRAFVFSVASDGDCHRHPPYFQSQWESAFYRAGLRRAQRVIAQTHSQAAKLKAQLNCEATVIPMPCADAPDRNGTAQLAADRPRVLWIGRVCPVKRPELLLEIARACPELAFDLVGPCDADEYGRSIAREARSLPNVAVHGAVPRAEVHTRFQNAAILCCTSEYEGFPNTFLEAWNHGLPVVSTFDPDSIIAQQGLGVAVSDAPAAATAIRNLLGDPNTRRDIGTKARRYYQKTHTLESTMPRFEAVLREAIDACAAHAGRGPR